jgi:hypothetical protein
MITFTLEGNLYTVGLWTVVFSQKVMMTNSMVHLSIGDKSSNQKEMMRQRRMTTATAMKRHNIRSRDSFFHSKNKEFSFEVVNNSILLLDLGL